MVINLPLLATISCNNETNTNSIINQINGETIVKSPLYTDDSFKSTWAHSESYTNEQVKSFIETNKDKIFHNLPQETTISSIESVYKVVEGKIEVKVKFSGKVHNKEGQLVDVDSNKEYKVELIGFKTTNLTTYLSSTELDIKEISELSSKKASEIVSLDQENLKNKIKDLVKDLFLDKAIEVSDIEITTQDSNANDAKGTLDLKVSIKNNKAWENGVKKEKSKEFNLKLTGFKIQAPTKIANFEIKDLKKDTFSKHYATPFGKWSEGVAATTTETQTDEQANEELLKTELEKHVKSIFNNEPEDVTIKEVKINKDYTIGSIQNGYDAAHGAVYIVVTLNKYYDENGKLVDISSSADENKGKFYFKVTGFKVDGNMTTYLDYGSLYDDPELNAINLREPSAAAPASKQTSSETSIKISTIKASQWKENIDFIKQEIEKKLLLEPPVTGVLGSLIKNKVYGDDKWHEVTSTYTAAGDENWGIEIDANQQAIFDDAKGTLTLEVTFKNVWWKNGVFIKEHKEVIRFSGFNNWIDDKIQLNEVTYNPYLQVVEEVKTEDTKEKIAVISNPEFGDVDFIDYLLFDFYQANINQIDQILKDDYQYTDAPEGGIDLIPGEGLEVGTEVLKKVVQDVLGASIKFSILKSLGAYPVEVSFASQQKSITTELEFLLGMNYTDYLAGLEKFEVKSEAPVARELSTLKNKIKVTNINWNENVGDTFNFTIEIIEDTPTYGTKNQNVQKFNFKLIGFLGANNTKIEEPPVQSLTAEVVPAVDVNSNNDISKKDLFDMKWTTHQYSDSEGIKNPQFYGHYWYSLDIVIKDTVPSTSLIDTTTQGLYDKIKNNKLSDFYLHLEDVDVIAYDIVKDESKKELTVKFKHEKWSTISSLFDPKPTVKRKQTEVLPQQLYFHLSVSNLGSFDFTKIFVLNSTELGPVAGATTSTPPAPEFDTDKFPVLERYSKSIFAAEFVKDNYDQYGSIKLKGYDLPIDIDQYDFWYKDEASQEFKELDNSKANIVEKYEAQVDGTTKVNVFVEIQFNLDGAEKLSKNTKLYVSLKNDQNNKHLIKI